MRREAQKTKVEKKRHWQLIYVQCSLLFHFKFCSGTRIDFKYNVMSRRAYELCFECNCRPKSEKKIDGKGI